MGTRREVSRPVWTLGTVLSLLLLLASLFALVAVAEALRDRAGSVDPGIARGDRIEVRYWPGGDRSATETVGELPVPEPWVLAIPGAGLLVGFAGLLIAARRGRARSS